MIVFYQMNRNVLFRIYVQCTIRIEKYSICYKMSKNHSQNSYLKCTFQFDPKTYVKGLICPPPMGKLELLAGGEGASCRCTSIRTTRQAGRCVLTLVFDLCQQKFLLYKISNKCSSFTINNIGTHFNTFLQIIIEASRKMLLKYCENIKNVRKFF